jgi:hypothetical protein
MPGFSRAGPHGEGPKTGWGRGYCGTSTRNTGKRFWSSGRFGWGRLRGWRNRYWATGIPGRAWWHDREASTPPLTSQEEIALLQDEAKIMEKELKVIRKTLSEFQAKEPPNKNVQEE